MNELKKTYIFGGIAIGLALIAFISTPGQVAPDDFEDKGELFFPEFTDPNEAISLEVLAFDEESGEAKPFKVEFSDGRWSIPSHHNYPADGKDRLAKTAAGVIDIRKDDFRSDLASDHEAFGVVDPLDETATSLTGRGTRITLKGNNGTVLADFIIGKEIEGRTGLRFVRIPEQKRVYAARMDIDISTNFADWIEADLLLVDKEKIDDVIIKDYSINERTQALEERDVVILNKGDGTTWTANKMSASQEVDDTKMKDLLTALDELKIVGVRPKPEGITGMLKRTADGRLEVNRNDVRSLQSRGYYFTRNGSLVSNEGEFQAKTSEGIMYTLRFGEVAYGTGTDLTAGTGSAQVDNSGSGENRYLFITAEFDPTIFKEPAKPANTDFESKADSLWTDEDKRNKEIADTYKEWESNIEKGNKLHKDLNDRFGPWYYVISSASFDKLRLTRNDLVKNKEAEDKK